MFILWFGWFGFNGGSQLAISGADNSLAVSSIILNTNIAAAMGAMTSMIITWVRHGKPGLSLSLNGGLAGLVAITAGCDIVTPGGAAIIGIIAAIRRFRRFADESPGFSVSGLYSGRKLDSVENASESVLDP